MVSNVLMYPLFQAYSVSMPIFLLFTLFVLMPIIEISVLIRVGSTIGVVNTIAFVIFTAMLGAYLVRQQGLATLTKLQTEANAGRVPAMQMVEGVILLIAGAVLLTPGFVTDAIGFSLLVPPIRQGVIKWAATRFFNGNVHYHTTASTQPFQSSEPNANRHGAVIEGEYTSDDQNRQ